MEKLFLHLLFLLTDPLQVPSKLGFCQCGHLLQKKGKDFRLSGFGIMGCTLHLASTFSRNSVYVSGKARTEANGRVFQMVKFHIPKRTSL